MTFTQPIKKHCSAHNASKCDIFVDVFATPLYKMSWTRAGIFGYRCSASPDGVWTQCCEVEWLENCELTPRSGLLIRWADKSSFSRKFFDDGNDLDGKANPMCERIIVPRARPWHKKTISDRRIHAAMRLGVGLPSGMLCIGPTLPYFDRPLTSAHIGTGRGNGAMVLALTSGVVTLISFLSL